MVNSGFGTAYADRTGHELERLEKSQIQ